MLREHHTISLVLFFMVKENVSFLAKSQIK